MLTLLVTGSENGRIEIIKENFTTKVCNQTPDYLVEVWSAAVSNWKDDKFAICGGFPNGKRISKCYSLVNGEWTLIANLTTPRSGHGASIIDNSNRITGGAEVLANPVTKVLKSLNLMERLHQVQTYHKQEDSIVKSLMVIVPL